MKKFVLRASKSSVRSLSVVLLGATTLSAGAQTLADAIKLTDKEQFDKATLAFRKVIASEPQNGEAWFYFGENYWENQQADSAEACYRQGNGVGGKFPLNKVGLGKVLWAQGKKAEAQTMFDQAIADATDKANKIPKPQQANTYREIAEAMAQGARPDLIKAQELIARSLELDAKNPETYVLKGDVLFDLNPRDGSAPLENYKIAINMDALNAKPVTRKAFMYYRAKNNPAAIEEYTRAIGIDGSFAPAYSGRAEAYVKTGDFVKAEADMAHYLELNTGNQSARVRYAQFLFLVGKYQESLGLINTLEQEGVKNIVLKRLQGYDQVEMKDSVNAKSTLEAYFAEQPEDKRIAADYEYYGKSLLLVHQDSLAAENMLKGARMDRTKDHLYTEAAKTFVRARAYERAVAAMQERIAAGKPETNDYYYLGDAALKAGMYQTADSAWATYTQRNPNAYQGYRYRAQTQAATDTLAIGDRTWSAKPYYDEMLLKMKPEEREKSKSHYEEALNYMGLYYLYNKEARDLPKAKCYFEQVKALNAGTSITKQVNEVMLMTKELKDVTPAGCE